MGDGDHGWAAAEFLSLLRDIVVRDTADGVLLSCWGTRGRDAGQFASPHGIAIDPQSHVLVADTNNGRIQQTGGVA